MSNNKLTMALAGFFVLGVVLGVLLGSGESGNGKTVTVAQTVTTTRTVDHVKTETVTDTQVRVRYKTRLRYRTVTEPASVAASDQSAPGDGSASSGCSSEYTGACVPDGLGDVNCGDIPDTDFASVGSDPYGLDRDGDGVACES